MPLAVNIDFVPLEQLPLKNILREFEKKFDQKCIESKDLTIARAIRHVEGMCDDHVISSDDIKLNLVIICQKVGSEIREYLMWKQKLIGYMTTSIQRSSPFCKTAFEVQILFTICDDLHINVCH